MTIRLARPAAAVALLAALWGLDSIRGGRPGGRSQAPVAAGRVRILAFYASSVMVAPGERATLCYGVENAKSVSISPMLEGVYPSKRRCLEVVPRHTTNYTLMAEGYDGTVAARTLTLPVHAWPPAKARPLNLALLVF
jgi:hypothetical protein